MAVNCLVSPLATLGETGVKAIEDSVAAVTVSVSTGLVIPSSAAVMSVVPTASVLARPELLIVATDGVADTQTTWLVRSSIVPSV